MLKPDEATRFGKAIVTWLVACVVFYLFHRDLSDTVLAIWFVPAIILDVSGIGQGLSLDKMPWLVLMPLIGLLLLLWAARRSSAVTLLVTLWYIANMAAAVCFLRSL